MTKFCPRGKAAAKRKFKVYPSAYANAYASKICAGKIKDPSGVKRKDFKGPKPAAKGAMMEKSKKIKEKLKKLQKTFDKKRARVGQFTLAGRTFGKRAGGMTEGAMMEKPKGAVLGFLFKKDKKKENKKSDVEKKAKKKSDRLKELKGEIDKMNVGGIAKTAGAQSAMGRLEKSGMKLSMGGMADYYKDLM